MNETASWVVVAETPEGKLKSVTVKAPTEVAALCAFQQEHPTWKLERIARKSK